MVFSYITSNTNISIKSIFFWVLNMVRTQNITLTVERSLEDRLWYLKQFEDTKIKIKIYTIPRLFSSYMLTQLACFSIRDAKSLKVYLRSAEVNSHLSSIKSEQNKIY